MLEFLAGIDHALFIFLNVTVANPFTDALMPVVTDDMFLRVLYGAAMGAILWRGDARLRWLVLASALVLLLTDQTSSHLLKPLIGRARPCHVLENINLLVGCGGGLSMPSSHAANAFGQGVLFSLVIRQTKWYLWVFAAVVAISRVFVGVHYPGDVFVGAVIGGGYGWLIAIAFRKFDEKYLKNRRDKTNAAEA